MSAATRRLLGPHVKALMVESRNYFYLVDPEDYGVGRHLRRNGQYGCEELERLSNYVTAQSRVLVVGTHVGTLAIPLADRCHSVVAIEANPNTFGLLKANIAINGIENLTAYNLAASDREQELKFLMNRSNSGGSKIKPQVDDFQYYYDHPEEITVQGFPLDQQFPDDSFDLIVMDIEGSEYFALRGMQALLRRSKTLVVEFVPHHLRNVSNVTVKDFLQPLAMFDSLHIPVLDQTVPNTEFANVLNRLYVADRSDDGIVFQRS